MKAIMISIRPQWVAKILNGEKTIEIRKMFPSDYVGWVYIYATKGKPLVKCSNGKWYVKDKDFKYDMTFSYYAGFNGKVVARFWCDKVERVWKTTTNIWTYGSDLEPNFYKESCLNDIEFNRYFKPTKVGFDKTFGKAIHITKLEIFFGKPKEISEFKVRRNDCPFPCDICNVRYCQLKRPPQSWQFIEV